MVSSGITGLPLRDPFFGFSIEGLPLREIVAAAVDCSPKASSVTRHLFQSHAFIAFFAFFVFIRTAGGLSGSVVRGRRSSTADRDPNEHQSQSPVLVSFVTPRVSFLVLGIPVSGTQGSFLYALVGGFCFSGVALRVSSLC